MEFHDRFVVAHQAAMDHGTLFDGTAIAIHCFKSFVQLRQRNLGKESQRTKIYAEDGNLGGSDRACRGQECAVAAQHQHELRVMFPNRGALDRRTARGVSGGLIVEHRAVAVLLKPLEHFRNKFQELGLVRLADDRDRFHGSG